MSTAAVKNRKTENTSQILNQLLKEIRSLREDFMLFLPQEDLKDYAHPRQIKKSYLNALRKYPRQF